HARRFLRRGRVEARDRALRHGARHQNAVRDARQVDLGGVARFALDLERPVGTVDRLADNAHAAPPAVRTARTMARCASCTLNWLSLYALAFATAAADLA